jgi:hypothetical protein
LQSNLEAEACVTSHVRVIKPSYDYTHIIVVTPWILLIIYIHLMDIGGIFCLVLQAPWQEFSLKEMGYMVNMTLVEL